MVWRRPARICWDCSTASLGEEAEAVTVVFDAARSLPGIASEQEFKGIHVQYATAKQEADDVIEQLIRQASAPKTLNIVSDDHRLQQAAQRRGCRVRGCEEFLAWLDKHRQTKNRQKAELPEKRDKLSDTEINRWLAEFGGIERDPTLKRAFEPNDFE